MNTKLNERMGAIAQELAESAIANRAAGNETTIGYLIQKMGRGAIMRRVNDRRRNEYATITAIQYRAEWLKNNS